MWIVRRRCGSKIEERKTFHDEGKAREAARQLLGLDGCRVEIEKAVAGSSHRLHIEVI
jgi:hypothetical protein